MFNQQTKRCIVVNYIFHSTKNDVVWVKDMKAIELLGVLQWTSFTDTCPVFAIASKI